MKSVQKYQKSILNYCVFILKHMLCLLYVQQWDVFCLYYVQQRRRRARDIWAASAWV